MPNLQNNKILDKSKFKAPTELQNNVTYNLKLVLGMVENIFWGKGGNARYQHFPFPKRFLKRPFSRSFKLRIVS